MSITVDRLGLIGAILVAIPFLNEQRIRRFLYWFGHGGTLPGLESLGEASRQTMLDELNRFKPGDGALVGWGVLLIALSYALHMAAEVVAYLRA